MSTLLLRLAAPLQSWGMDKFERRGTERIPTKSGVIGLVAAALGIRRNESIVELQNLKFGVRVDKEGNLLRDFHMVEAKKPYVTIRYYLSDAVFLVGLEGNDGLLNSIAQALNSPAFPLFLGRRSCPPEGKVFWRVRQDKGLLEVLQEEPRLVCDNNKPKEKLRIEMDGEPKMKNSYLQRDMPVSFSYKHRQYDIRTIALHNVDVRNDENILKDDFDYTEHDAFNVLKGD
ncbi:MAG: type I-E CRISPR-associated protein Cas5/CasD [Negativicutes bacterium]|nr:type I-E CRISPR-associated protein Cas5/CasD [Negativicutes bacterium]